VIVLLLGLEAVPLCRHSAVLLEGVARAVESGEPVLLVGETGVGKTASVQFLAQQTGRSGSLRL